MGLSPADDDHRNASAAARSAPGIGDHNNVASGSAVWINVDDHDVDDYDVDDAARAAPGSVDDYDVDDAARAASGSVDDYDVDDAARAASGSVDDYDVDDAARAASGSLRSAGAVRRASRYGTMWAASLCDSGTCRRGCRDWIRIAGS